MVLQRTGCVVLAILIVIVVIWGGSWLMTQTIPAGHVGILFAASSGIEKDKNGQVIVYPPRRLFVPPMTQLYIYPTLTQAAIYSQDASWGEDKSADGIQVTTNDNAQNVFDVIVYYRVLPVDVGTIFKTFGAIPIGDIQTLHIRRAVKEVVNVVGPQHDAFELMGKSRKVAATTLVTELQRRLKPKGITVEKAFLLQAYPNQQVLAKITGRVNAYTQLTIAGINNQIALKDKRIAVVKAEAASRAARIASAQTVGASFDMLKAQSDRAAVEAWDGMFSPFKSGQLISLAPGTIEALRQEGAKAPANGGTP